MLFQEVVTFLKKRQTLLSYVVLITILTAFCELIIKDADWIFDVLSADDYQFLQTTAVGKEACAWAGGGRFWPLGLVDYNIMRLIPNGTTPLAHLSYNCVTLILSSLIFFAVLNKVTGNRKYLSLLCMFILFASSSFVQIHMVCFYAEREMFLMFSVFLYLYQKALDNDHPAYHLSAFAAAVYLTYLKEPMFGCWIIFAGFNLLFGRISYRMQNFNYALLVNAAIWLLTYFYVGILLLHFSNEVYNDAGISKLSDLSLKLFSEDTFFYVLIAIAAVRFWAIVRKKSRLNPLTDTPLFMGMGYAAAYIILNFHCNYYLFPAIVLGMPAFALYVKNHKNQAVFIIILSIVCSAISAKHSCKVATDILYHRRVDSSLFRQMVSELDSGKDILFVCPRKKVRGNKQKFERYQIFLGYYTNSKFSLEKTSDYSRINENTIVICSDETIASEDFREIDAQMQKNGLKLFHSNSDLGTKIFKRFE